MNTLQLTFIISNVDIYILHTRSRDFLFFLFLAQSVLYAKVHFTGLCDPPPPPSCIHLIDLKQSALIRKILFQASIA